MELITNNTQASLVLSQETADSLKGIKYLTTSDLNKLKSWELIRWVDTADYLNEDAKDILKQRIGNVNQVPETSLKQVCDAEKYPTWFRKIVKTELERRESFQNKKVAKQQERVDYLKAKPKKKTAAYYKLLDAHWQHSIFKVKWQFKEPNKHGDYWLSKKYSRDYGDERTRLEGIGDQLLRKMIREKGEFGYELFYKGGLKDAGFNGFMYSMKTFNSLRETDKIGFFAVYLNNVLEQHVNEEFYSMEIWRWGELKGGR